MTLERINKIFPSVVAKNLISQGLLPYTLEIDLSEANISGKPSKTGASPYISIRLE